jgi:phospholipid-binding lipoprotein MlaA
LAASGASDELTAMRTLAWSRKASLAIVLLLAGPVLLSGCAAHARNGAGADVRLARDTGEIQDYDPWEPFNERMFAFNRKLDEWVVKPVAKGWRAIAPEPVRDGIGNALRNVGFPRRFVNSLFQLKLDNAALEVTTFIVNSTVGLGGFIDIGSRVGLTPRDEDTGQTLGTYGVGPGPYLVLPFLPPSTVRDSIGGVFDMLLDPTTYLVPFAGNLGKRAGKSVNERSDTLERYDEIEKDVVDLYSAARNAYLQRREREISE